MAETKRLEVEILEGRKNMVLAKNTRETLESEKEDAEGKIAFQSLGYNEPRFQKLCEAVESELRKSQ